MLASFVITLQVDRDLTLPGVGYKTTMGLGEAIPLPLGQKPIARRADH